MTNVDHKKVQKKKNELLQLLNEEVRLTNFEGYGAPVNNRLNIQKKRKEEEAAAL